MFARAPNNFLWDGIGRHSQIIKGKNDSQSEPDVSAACSRDPGVTTAATSIQGVELNTFMSSPGQAYPISRPRARPDATLPERNVRSLRSSSTPPSISRFSRARWGRLAPPLCVFSPKPMRFRVSRNTPLSLSRSPDAAVRGPLSLGIAGVHSTLQSGFLPMLRSGHLCCGPSDQRRGRVLDS